MKRLWGVAFLLGALAISACQPISSDSSGSTVPAVAVSSTAPTVLMLPDGAECSWAGSGETMVFDGVPVTYVCNILNTVLLGDPVFVDDIHWTVTEGTLAPGASSTELAESRQLTFLLAELQLADGTSCLNAGTGATFAVNDQRVNWTCGERGALVQAVVAGPVTPVGPDAPGVYQVSKSQVEQASDGSFSATDTVAVTVARIIGSDPVVSTMPGQNGGGLPPAPADPTTIVLPDGNTCLWAGEGATLAFDGKRVNYTCSTENTVLIGDPTVVEDAVWTMTLGTLNGTALASSEEVTFQLNELDLVDGSICLNAGRGATVGVDGQRLNWTCGDATDEGQYGVFGPLTAGGADEPGAYIANKILFTMGDSGATAKTTFAVPVTTIVGGDVQQTPGEIAMATEAASSTYTSPAGFSITIPASWIANNYTVVELTGDDAAEYHPLAQNVTRFVYTPLDSTYAPFPVLTIYTFTTEDWATVDTQSGPPVGSEVATGDGVVYVASTPQSNPYPEGTQDATNFNAMAADIGAAVSSIQ